MAPSWYPAVIAVTLYDVRDRPAIDLEMESQIPSEVRHSLHNQATRRGTPLRNSADGNCAQKSKNQKNLVDETGVSVSWHIIRIRLVFRQWLTRTTFTTL